MRRALCRELKARLTEGRRGMGHTFGGLSGSNVGPGTPEQQRTAVTATRNADKQVAIATFPYTTACSPSKISLPGAEAVEVKGGAAMLNSQRHCCCHG